MFDLRVRKTEKQTEKKKKVKKVTKSNKAQMTTMQSKSITIVAQYSNKCMANYLNETDNNIV